MLKSTPVDRDCVVKHVETALIRLLYHSRRQHLRTLVLRGHECQGTFTIVSLTLSKMSF